MFAFERVARLFVIESFGVPLDKWEVEPVVIGVALHALLAGARADTVRRM